MKAHPKILVVTHVYPRHPDDDVAPFLLRYVHELQAVGAAVTVVAPHEPGLPERHEVDGATVHRVRYGDDEQETLAYQGDMHQRVISPTGAVRFTALVRAMRRAVKAQIVEIKPDVVDVQWLVPGIWFLPGFPRTARLQIAVLGTDLALLRRVPGGNAYGRRVLKRADSVVVMSREAQEAVANQMGRHDATILPPPPNTPARSIDDPPDNRRLLSIGRLVPEKGHRELVQAMTRLEPPAALTIVGTGPERDRLQDLAEELGVDVALPGPVPPSSIDDAVEACDLFVIPSHREGFCLVAQEAMLRGRPVVGTVVGALPEQLAPTDAGPTGWLVPVNDPDTLGDTIQQALADPGRHQIAERGRARAEALLAEHRERLRQQLEYLLADRRSPS